MTNELNKVVEVWSQYEPVVDAGNFYNSPLIRPYILETAYGKDYIAKYQHDSNFAEDIFISEYLNGKKIESMLSLCCGFGIVERIFASQLPDLKECLGVDVAVGALEIARKRAVEAGLQCVSYQQADLNNYPWEDEKYDLVVANGALHHLSNLEGALEGIKRTLKPGGILYACEYVGPSYVDHSARQLQIINAAAFLVPPELRARRALPFSRNKRLTPFISRLYSVAERNNPEWSWWKKLVAGALKKLLKRNEKSFDFGIVHVSLKEELLKTDPSECVRSAEVISVVKNTFDDVEIKPMGGGILMHALDANFYNHFDANNPSHTKCREMLFQLERHFMDTGEIGMENAFIIARK